MCRCVEYNYCNSSKRLLEARDIVIENTIVEYLGYGQRLRCLRYIAQYNSQTLPSIDFLNTEFREGMDLHERHLTYSK